MSVVYYFYCAVCLSASMEPDCVAYWILPEEKNAKPNITAVFIQKRPSSSYSKSNNEYLFNIDTNMREKCFGSTRNV